MRTAYAAITALALATVPLAAQETDDAPAEGEAAESQEQPADAATGDAATGDAAAEAEAPDEVETALEAALDAYRGGDLEMATEEVEYAQQLMQQLKTQQLAGFLPEPLDGWVREEGETGGMPGLGGMMASATYVGPEDNVEIQIMADNQMVASMMMMFNNAAMIGQMGELMRIGRQKVIRTDQDELQTMLDNNVLVTIAGDAPVETKTTYLEAMDLRAIEDF